MARKSLQDLSGIANTIARSGSKPSERAGKTSAPALGALQGSLSAIREIDTTLIDDWGPTDRLDMFTAVNSDEADADGLDALIDSIRDGGQQVPILLRKAPQEGRFQIIFGRRRLQACKMLGIKVKANIQDLDDATALLAKGLENAARRNLSFYERARFSAAIKSAGHDSKTVCQVLNLTRSGLSHLTKVAENVPNGIGDLIGPAPKSGRPKWTSLAEAFADKKISTAAAKSYLTSLEEGARSDDRLELLLKEINRRGARPTEGTEVSPVEGVTIKSGRGSIAVSIKKTGQNAGFATWLDGHLEQMIRDAHAEFTAVNSDKTT